MRNGGRALALFYLGIDSKLRACDLVKLRVRDVCHGDRVASRATVLRQKTQRPVPFELLPSTREAVGAWMRKARMRSDEYLLASRLRRSPHLGTRQYAGLLDVWAPSAGPDLAGYRAHPIRRTKASLINRQTKNLRAVPLLPRYAELENTVRYLGIELDDALELAEHTDA